MYFTKRSNIQSNLSYRIMDKILRRCRNHVPTMAVNYETVIVLCVFTRHFSQKDEVTPRLGNSKAILIQKCNV